MKLDESEVSTAASSLVSKPNCKSAVWKYFGFRPDSNGKPDDMDKPLCKVCQTVVHAKTGNTSNLRFHLKQRHPQLFSEVMKNSLDVGKEPKEKTIQEHFEAPSKLSTSSREHKDLTRSITYFLCKDMSPSYTVEKSGFMKMLAKFNPRYDLPSRNYFSRIAIPSLYSEVKSEIQQQFSDGQFFYAGTTDLWSSLTSEPYLSYTAHYIDKQ